MKANELIQEVLEGKDPKEAIKEAASPTVNVEVKKMKPVIKELNAMGYMEGNHYKVKGKILQLNRAVYARPEVDKLLKKYM